jgi:hypothetical protein
MVMMGSLVSGKNAGDHRTRREKKVHERRKQESRK